MSFLFGKLANVCGDLSPDALQGTGMFKQLTGGDTIDAEIKYGGHIQFCNFAKMIFSTNQMPVNKDDTPAFFDRWTIISFPNKFRNSEVEDKTLTSRLTTERELSGLFNLALKGLKRLLYNGKFSNNKSTEEIRDYYIRLSNPQHAFVMDMLEVSPEDWIEKKVLYQKYTEYCRNNQLIPISDATFGKNLPKYITVQDYRPRLEDNKRVTAWKGIQFFENTDGTEISTNAGKIDMYRTLTKKTDTDSNGGQGGPNLALGPCPKKELSGDMIFQNGQSGQGFSLLYVYEAENKVNNNNKKREGYIEKGKGKIYDQADHSVQPEIETIAASIREWETHIHGRPLGRYDIHKFLLWFTQNIDHTLPADRIRDHVWRIKGFTPETQDDENARMLEKDGFVRVKRTSITFLGKEILVEVWEQPEEER
jgi:phage/plasmid-associated DNA primase